MPVKHRNSQIIKITSKKKDIYLFLISSIKWGISIEMKIYEDLEYPTRKCSFSLEEI